MPQQLLLNFPFSRLLGRAGALWRTALLALSGAGLALSAHAQCPIPACLPGSAPAANVVFGAGIFRVQVADLDTTTRGSIDGYQDYSCVRGASLTRGTSYRLQVATNPTADETVRAWVDFDNNGVFSQSELVLISQGRHHSGLFTVPSNVAVGAVLRLRIAADLTLAPTPGPCTSSSYSQTEDYRVRINAALPPKPRVAFSGDSVSCTGVSQFLDASLNAPTTWRWDFGDGQTSIRQHPVHAYAMPGVYTVRLRACNASGCDSLTKVAYVNVLADIPRAASCQPATVAYCCQFGLAQVQLAGLSHAPGGGALGYVDASCAHRATLHADRRDTLRLLTGQASAQDIRAYLDYNDDGQFDPVAELLYTGLGVRNPVIALQIPSSTPGLVYQRPLRLRLCADYAGSPAVGPCASPQQGQVVDYSVVVLPNTIAPQAAFAVSFLQFCGPTQIQLLNTSVGATAYTWDFGDGTTATVASPTHAYTQAGVYDIQLVARNTSGTDTLVRQVAVAPVCLSYCIPTGHGGSMDAAAYFTRVQFGSLDNTAGRGPGVGYRDFTAQYAIVEQGQTVVLRTESPAWSFAGPGPWAKVAAWIDYNHDGQFGASELTAPVTSYSPHTLSIRIPAAAMLGATRLRVVIQDFQEGLPNSSCSPVLRNASTEDYTVIIMPPALAPTADFAADLPVSCSGTVQFQDRTSAGPTHWQWSFGDGTISSLQHPTHAYTATGTYPVTLRVSNRYGSHTLTRPNFVTVSGIGAGPLPAACLPVGGNTGPYWGIGQLTIGSALSYGQAVGTAGYVDETCTVPALHLARTAAHAVSFTAATAPGASPSGAYSVYMWLDANEDGAFDSTNELVYSSNPYSVVQTGVLSLSSFVPLNRPLRLRVHYIARTSSSSIQEVPSSCQRDEELAQVRDFTVIATSTIASNSKPRQYDGSWSLFPNPVRDNLTLYGHINEAEEVGIFNAMGTRVGEARLVPSQETQIISVQMLAPGVYFLASSKSLRRIRFIKQ